MRPRGEVKRKQIKREKIRAMSLQLDFASRLNLSCIIIKKLSGFVVFVCFVFPPFLINPKLV